MPIFTCPECGNTWSEGPTRDFRKDAPCRVCLKKSLTSLLTPIDGNDAFTCSGIRNVYAKELEIARRLTGSPYF